MKIDRRKLRIALFLLIGIPILVAITGGVYIGYSYQRIDLNRQLEQPSVMFDRNGESIGRFAAEIREVISLNDMSPYLLDAVVAIEDTRFYEHWGVDIRGIGRALWRNFIGRRVVEGGSTITQQLAKNEYFIGEHGPARTFDRKIREAVYAIKLERTLTKDEILERYLNRVYFGHGRFGVEAASQYYFSKSASELNLSESALLVGITNSPGLFSLRDNPERSHQRRDIILARMEELGMITGQERAEAQAITLTAAPLQERPARANHFRVRVEDELRNILRDNGLEEKEVTNLIYNQGLQVHTTLSLQAQAAAEQVVQDHRDNLLGLNEKFQAVVVAIDPATGGIMATVENIELTGTWLRANERYNVGSSLKGVLYAAALENGYTASSTVLCEETIFPWQPQPFVPNDFDGGWHNRELRIREALVVSCNVSAIKVGLDIGMQTFVDYAARLNPALRNSPIGDPDKEIQIPLGPRITPLNLSLAYAPMVNGGYSVEPYTITEIRDRNGNIIYRHYPQRQSVLDPRIGYITTNMLQGVQGVTRLPFPAAGKTGTATNGNVTLVGYTPEIVATVFFGFDRPGDGTLERNSVELAAPAWRQFMEQFYRDSTPPPFPRPVGIEDATVCTISGQLATPFCPETYQELFMPGTIPERCEVHTGNLVEICDVTGFPASRWCPQDTRRLEQRQPWMRNVECWFHGPRPGDQPEPPDDIEDGDQDDEVDEEDDDENDTD